MSEAQRDRSAAAALTEIERLAAMYFQVAAESFERDAAEHAYAHMGFNAIANMARAAVEKLAARPAGEKNLEPKVEYRYGHKRVDGVAVECIDDSATPAEPVARRLRKALEDIRVYLLNSSKHFQPKAYADVIAMCDAALGGREEAHG